VHTVISVVKIAQQLFQQNLEKNELRRSRKEYGPKVGQRGSEANPLRRNPRFSSGAHMRKFYLTVAAILTFSTFSASFVLAQTNSAPPNAVRAADGKYKPAPGYKWANDKPGDLTVVKAGPSQEQIGRAVIKSLGALVLHEASKPQPDDDFGDMLVRNLSRTGRDSLIDSALEDLLTENPINERLAVRGLVVLALDGRLSRDRDKVVAQLRRTNNDMANAVEAAEFLILLGKAVNDKR
jgi:hypothetical protein